MTNIPTLYGAPDFGSQIFVQGFFIVPAGPTQLFVSQGSARSFTSDYVIQYSNNVPSQGTLFTVNADTVGINGCFPRPISEITPVSGVNLAEVIMCGDSSGKLTPGAIIKTGNKILPPGYNTYSVIGYAVINSSGTLEPFVQTGEINHRTILFNEPISVLTAGNATTRTTVSLEPLPQVITTSIKFLYSFTPAANTNVASIVPSVLNPTTYPIQIQSPAAAEIRGNFDLSVFNLMPLSLDYLVTNAGDSLSLWICGFDYDLFIQEAG